MFTDTEDSTGLAARFGDARIFEMVRARDAHGRRDLKRSAGREIKHTGDGIMTCFEDAEADVECACAIQRAFADFNRGSSDELRVRIELDAGEPVEDSTDLFEAPVQRAARLCRDADPEAVVVSAAIRDLINTRFAVRELGRSRLKGFVDPVEAFEIVWR
jgi:class 3 adenylate cyclase